MAPLTTSTSQSTTGLDSADPSHQVRHASLYPEGIPVAPLRLTAALSTPLACPPALAASLSPPPGLAGPGPGVVATERHAYRSDGLPVSVRSATSPGGVSLFLAPARGVRLSRKGTVPGPATVDGDNGFMAALRHARFGGVSPAKHRRWRQSAAGRPHARRRTAVPPRWSRHLAAWCCNGVAGRGRPDPGHR